MAPAAALGWACLAAAAAWAAAAPPLPNASRGQLRGAGRGPPEASNPCASCPVCVSVPYGPRASSRYDDVCAPCALDAKSSPWPCHAVPAQCQCGSGPGPTPSPTPAPGAGPSVGSWFKRGTFGELFPHVESPPCTGAGFFTYEAFLEAAAAYPSFANSGDRETDRRELAAFLGQTSHETTGGWPSAPDGPLAWGYCWREELDCGTCSQYCRAGDAGYPCVAGQTYKGRGPMMFRWNYNYGAFSEALFGDKMTLLADAAQVAHSPVLSFKSAIWLWMTPRAPMPSCHDVMVGAWRPSPEDARLGRTRGFGMTTNILNGGEECGVPTGARVESRVGFYRRAAGLLGVGVGEGALYCNGTAPYR